jgi:hypothetical protein
MVGVGFAAVLGIVGFIMCSSQKGPHTDENRVQVRQRRAESNSVYEITKAIAEHGVHPARARGDIYRVNL